MDNLVLQGDQAIEKGAVSGEGYLELCQVPIWISPYEERRPGCFLISPDALFLLIVANGTPVVAARLLGQRFDYPLDGNRRAGDGQPWLGVTKTVRGFLLSILMTALAAVLMGMSWRIGVLFGLLAMAGDLLSSFIKRRFGLVSSSRVPGLDQLPESLLPLWGCASLLELEWQNIVLSAAAFWVLHLLFSRLFDRLHIR